MRIPQALPFCQLHLIQRFQICLNNLHSALLIVIHKTFKNRLANELFIQEPSRGTLCNKACISFKFQMVFHHFRLSNI